MLDFLFTKPHTPPTCTGRCSPFCSPASFKSSASTCLPRFWPSLLSTFGLLEKAHCSFLLLPSHFFFVPRCASKPVPPSRYSVRLSRDVEKAAASSRSRPGARADYINLARARRHPFDLAANVCAMVTIPASIKVYPEPPSTYRCICSPHSRSFSSSSS